MYADQAGVVDWQVFFFHVLNSEVTVANRHRANVGLVKAAFQPPAPKRTLYVASEVGVVAALNANKGNTGKITLVFWPCLR